MIQKIVVTANNYVTALAQLLAMIFIVIGIFRAAKTYLSDLFLRQDTQTNLMETRLEIGQTFSLALSFLIGSSILRSVITPTWEDIGKLAAIIAIRTILNYFLLNDVQKIHEISAQFGNGLKNKEMEHSDES